MGKPIVVLVAVAALLGGCLKGGTGPAAPTEPFHVAAVRTHNLTIASFDGTALAATVLEPVGKAGTSTAWPVLVFLHGWGSSHATFRNLPLRSADGQALPSDVLMRFAQAGFLVVAYDARGFGRSEGLSTLAGPAELADLDAVVGRALSDYPNNGAVGLTGYSYGGGQALLAWGRGAADAAAVQMAWLDLADGLLPGNVPKGPWAGYFLALGHVGGRVHPMVDAWAVDATLRRNMDNLQAALAARSVGRAFGQAPLLLCQGAGDSLFPQADLAWAAPGRVAEIVHPGGHGWHDAGCWDATLEWFREHLQGVPTGSQRWPLLQSVDARSQATVEFRTPPTTREQRWHLRSPDLADAPSQATFTVEQRFVGNPGGAPPPLADALGQPPGTPTAAGADPNAITFRGPAMAEAQVLIGAPSLRLVVPNASVPFQVAAQLLVETGGQSHVLTRGAAAALQENDLDNGTMAIQFHWTKADLAAGDVLVLKVMANDASWFQPLPASYRLVATGHSELSVPLFEPA